MESADKLAIELNKFDFDEVKNAYYITEMERLDYGGSAIVNSIFIGNRFEKDFIMLKEKFPAFKWLKIKLNKLYKDVEEDEQVLIVLSCRAKPYKKAIKNKYFNAIIIEI